MGVLVGKKAPNFKGAAVLGDGSIVDDYNFKKATEEQKKNSVNFSENTLSTAHLASGVPNFPFV